MGEFDEPRSHRERERVKGVRSILHHLIDHHDTEVLLTQSEHYHPEKSLTAHIMGFNQNGDFDELWFRLNAPDDVS